MSENEEHEEGNVDDEIAKNKAANAAADEERGTVEDIRRRLKSMHGFEDDEMNALFKDEDALRQFELETRSAKLAESDDANWDEDMNVLDPAEQEQLDQLRERDKKVAEAKVKQAEAIKKQQEEMKKQAAQQAAAEQTMQEAQSRPTEFARDPNGPSVTVDEAGLTAEELEAVPSLAEILAEESAGLDFDPLGDDDDEDEEEE